MARRPKKIIINENDYKLISRSKSWTAKHAAVGRIHYQPPLIEITNHDKNNIDLIEVPYDVKDIENFIEKELQRLGY